MRGFFFAIALLVSFGIADRAQPQSQVPQGLEAVYNLLACFDLTGDSSLPADRQRLLIEQCSKAHRGECELARQVLKDAGKSDATLTCVGRQ